MVNPGRESVHRIIWIRMRSHETVACMWTRNSLQKRHHTGHGLLALAMKPFTVMNVSGLSGGGLPPLRTSFREASAHCDTPKEAIMPSSELCMDSGFSVKVTVICAHVSGCLHAILSGTHLSAVRGRVGTSPAWWLRPRLFLWVDRRRSLADLHRPSAPRCCTPAAPVWPLPCSTSHAL